MSDSVDISKVPCSPFTTIQNFRDVGETINALSSASQPRLTTGRLFRSARPDEASAADLAALSSIYGIKTIIDVRSRTEQLDQIRKLEAQRAAEPPPQTEGFVNEDTDSRSTATEDMPAASPAPPPITIPLDIPGIITIPIDLSGGGYTRSLLWQLSWTGLFKVLYHHTWGDRVSALQILCSEIVAPRGLIGLGKGNLEHSRPEIGRVFEILADETRWPILVHCTQGKDRTGLLILLVSMLLQVGAKEVQADYQATERELAGEIEERVRDGSRIGLPEEFARCDPGYTRELERYVVEEYGGIEEYLEGCGVDGG